MSSSSSSRTPRYKRDATWIFASAIAIILVVVIASWLRFGGGGPRSAVSDDGILLAPIDLRSPPIIDKLNDLCSGDLGCTWYFIDDKVVIERIDRGDYTIEDRF